MKKETLAHIKFIQARFESEVTRALFSYLEARLHDKRIQNDDAVGNEVLKNQGAIEELKLFLVELKRKPVKSTGDGSYR